jgi:DNA-binding GntR family transcriptional regulator
MPEVQQPVPQHLQVADYYAQKILDGEIRDGEQMPSVRAIRREWNVGHNVAQRAIDHLKTGGLVRTGPGGTFATPGRAIYGPQQRLRATTFPGDQRVQMLAAAIVDSPEYVIPILGLEPGADGVTRVLRREWVTYVNASEPYMLSVMWCSPEFAGPVPELLTLLPLPGSGEAAQLIAERTGSPLTWGRTAHEARPVKDDGRESPLLRLPKTGHVLAEVYIWTSRDKVVVYTEFVVPEGKVIESDLAP